MSNIKTISSGFEIFKNSENNIIFFGTLVQEKLHCWIKYVEKNYEGRDGAFSVTREVQFSYSLKNNNIILDFPGLNSSVEIVALLKAQKNKEDRVNIVLTKNYHFLLLKYLIYLFINHLIVY